MNRDQRERLATARRLATAQTAGSAVQVASRSLPRRNGELSKTVVEVLAGAERPLRTLEIRHAVEAIAGAPVSGNSLKDCLHKNARRPNSPIERVTRGWYRHRDAVGPGRAAPG